MINLVHVLFYFHLASRPRLVLFTFGPELFYLLLAPTCFNFSGPELLYLLLAPTCFIFCWPRLVLFAFGPDLFYFPAVVPAFWYDL